MVEASPPPSKWWKSPTVIGILVANLVPLVGVLIGGWDLFPVLFLYWVENVIVGLFNVLRMLVAVPDKPALWLVKLFVIPFFCIHYGMFTFIHGIFVLGFFGGGFKGQAGFPTPVTFLERITSENLWWAVSAIFASHAFSFVRNYLMKGEFRTISPDLLMARPYGRVVILHVVVLFGGFLVMVLHAPNAVIALLVVLKIVLDIRGHLNERSQIARNFPLLTSAAETRRLNPPLNSR